MERKKKQEETGKRVEKVKNGKKQEKLGEIARHRK